MTDQEMPHGEDYYGKGIPELLAPQAVNEQVARKLGRWKTADGQFYTPTPDYCQSIQAAWEIISYLDAKDNTDITLETVSAAWTCVMYNFIAKKRAVASNEKAPMAICKAFLKLP